MSLSPSRAASIRRTFEYRIRRARAEVDAAKHNLREEQVARDEFELSQRPEFPTTGMRLTLEKAVQDVKDGHDPNSHQGRKIGDGVTSHGKWGYIWVNHGAPYGMAANGYLWRFTPGEADAMREHIKQFGATVVAEWPNENGYTFQLEVGH
ncbi:hypothetical protein SEA_PAVLO_99 [Microbacterium phage Pavlo]|nr:hypothetical protein SEA_PAVLO_99 [Microbacterium phage Pavlo]